jgi:hypothetical protein
LPWLGCFLRIRGLARPKTKLEGAPSKLAWAGILNPFHNLGIMQRQTDWHHLLYNIAGNVSCRTLAPIVTPSSQLQPWCTV